MIVRELEQFVKEAISQLGIEAPGQISFEHPENPDHGDYSSNVALVLGQQLKQNPNDLAQKIASKIKEAKFVSEVEVAGPGFLNFFLSQEHLLKELGEIVKKKEKYGRGKDKRKVMVEFTDPNPFKEFHIGHLYSNTVGESLARLFEEAGAEVKRANYQGDVGLHVAKAVWGMMQQNLSLENLEQQELAERVRFLGQSYAKGDKAYKEEGPAQKKIEELNAKIFAKDQSVKELYEKGRAWSLAHFETIYQRLGTKFDYYFFESEVGEAGKKLVEEGLKKGVFEKSRGAVIFPGEKHGLHSRVFINSQGLPTYEAKELGLAPAKYKNFKYDLSVIITGNEVIEYFKVLMAALQELNPELREKTEHLSHGMVRLPEGKMSSRTGNVVTAEQLIEEVKSRVRKIMKVSDVPAEEQEHTAEIVAIAAIKYSLLRVSLGKDIIFDFDKSLSLEGESGPYLQYTYARCRSILRQAKAGNLSQAKENLSLAKEEAALLRLLYRFEEVVQEAAQKFSPNIVATLAFEVARAYNNFYNTHRVLQAEIKEKKQFRLLLTAAAAQIIQNSLHLLGIKTPERM